MRLGRYFHDSWKVLQKHLPARRPAFSSKLLHDSGLDFVSGPVPDPAQEGWYVFSAVRNEVLRLPYFLHFYREMGCRLFIMADNESQDGTTKYLAEQPDVLLFRASGRYSQSRYGVDWLNALLHQFGRNRWCLTVDADELLVFPHCEHLGLLELTRYLEAGGANALPTFLLDMYSKAPIRKAEYQAGAWATPALASSWQCRPRVRRPGPSSPRRSASIPCPPNHTTVSVSHCSSPGSSRKRSKSLKPPCTSSRPTPMQSADSLC